MSTLRHPSVPPPGTVVGGRYLLSKPIAAGSMGTVFEATDTRDQSRVAVKLLHAELTTDPDVRRRFQRESSVLLALDHPNIVKLLDAGVTETERLYSVMELLHGETLSALLSRVERMTLDELVPVIDEIGQGLAAAHEHGVIHGDLKPANVFLVEGTTRRVRLVDFGLSKVLGLERLTRTGELIGTPAYMAPEQFTGRGPLDERIDTYALGVLLYECLSGRTPYRGNVPGKLMMDIVMGNAVKLADIAPELPSEVSAVVEQAMNRVAETRFENAVALAKAFRSASGR